VRNWSNKSSAGIARDMPGVDENEIRWRRHAEVRGRLRQPNSNGSAKSASALSDISPAQAQLPNGGIPALHSPTTVTAGASMRIMRQTAISTPARAAITTSATGLDRARASAGCDDAGCRNWAASGSFLRDLPDQATSFIERQDLGRFGFDPLEHQECHH